MPQELWHVELRAWLKLTDYRNQCKLSASHTREPSGFVQGAFLKLSINFDLSFELKLEQKKAVNCLLDRRDVFAVMPTGFGQRFFSAVLHSDRTEEDLRRRVSEQCDSNYFWICLI